MADIAGTYTDVVGALSRPALALLTRQAAPTVLSILRASFTGGPIPADRFLIMVGNHLEALRAEGHIDVPPTPQVRALLNGWVNENWLLYETTADGGEQYALTSHSQSALDYVSRAGRNRAMVSQSRIRSILDAARACADAANPDRASRISRLDEDISALTEERDRLASGGAMSESTSDDVIEAYMNLRELLDQLPADFLRVSEAVESEQRRILADFQSESLSTGAVVSEYLDRAARTLLQTAEGRAFQGAQELLRDTVLMEQLRVDVETTLDHAAAEALTVEERRDLRATPSLLEANVGAVLQKRHQNTRTIQHYVTRNAASTDREVDRLVKQLQNELLSWRPEGRARDDVPVAIQLPQINIGHLQLRFYDPADHRPPPPLEVNDTFGTAPELFELLQYGGPRLESLKSLLADALQENDAISAADAFNTSPDELRRPVEILGYFQLAERVQAVEAHAPTDLYRAIRPDGSTRTFSAVRLIFTRDHLSALQPRLRKR